MDTTNHRYFFEFHRYFLMSGLTFTSYAELNKIDFSLSEQLTDLGYEFLTSLSDREQLKFMLSEKPNVDFKSLETKIVDCYIDYFSNYLTIECYADCNYMSVNLAEKLISLGRKLYNASLPKQVEKFYVGKKVYFAVFCGSKRKNTVLLSECEIFTAESDLHNHLIKISK